MSIKALRERIQAAVEHQIRHDLPRHTASFGEEFRVEVALTPDEWRTVLAHLQPSPEEAAARMGERAKLAGDVFKRTPHPGAGGRGLICARSGAIELLRCSIANAYANSKPPSPPRRSRNNHWHVVCTFHLQGAHMDSETFDTMHPTTDELSDMPPVAEAVAPPEPSVPGDEDAPAREPEVVVLGATEAFNLLLRRQMQMFIALAQLEEQVTTALDVLLATKNTLRKTRKAPKRKVAKKGRGVKRR